MRILAWISTICICFLYWLPLRLWLIGQLTHIDPVIINCIFTVIFVCIGLIIGVATYECPTTKMYRTGNYGAKLHEQPTQIMNQRGK